MYKPWVLLEVHRDAIAASSKYVAGTVIGVAVHVKCGLPRVTLRQDKVHIRRRRVVHDALALGGIVGVHDHRRAGHVVVALSLIHI